MLGRVGSAGVPGGLTRRRLLGAGAGVVAGLSAGGLAGCARAVSRRERVAVIGSGLAGLVAGYELHQAGWDVLVLEARDRVGGRVHTIRGFRDGQIAEAGGEYIDTDHTALLGYVRLLGLRLDNMNTSGSDQPGAVYTGGRRMSQNQYATPAVQRSVHRYNTRIAALSDPLDPADPVPGGAALDHRSVGSLIDSLHLDSRARELVGHDTIRDDYTVEPGRLSLLAVAQAESVGPNLPEYDYEAYRVHGGNDQVPRGLAAALGRRVQLSAPVTSIEWSHDGVRVGVAGETVTADHCVLAAPLPPLRAVRFRPAPPAPLAAAIAGLQYGIGTKTLLQYSRRFWTGQGFDGDTETDLPVSTTWEATNAQPGRPGILIAYTMGAFGARYTALPPAERISAGAGQLDRIYPGSRPLLIHAFTIAWANERYTGGTYSAFAPGQVTRFWSALRTPVGPIHLAGEHTDEYWGYMEGAVRSGQRAAKAIAGKSLGRSVGPRRSPDAWLLS